VAARVMSERRPRPALQQTDDTASTRSPAEDLADTLLSPPAGEPLRPDTLAYLEPRLGHSLSNVRVHTDSRADDLARMVNAEAFTTGSDIYLRSGAYDPQSRSGVKLLAHEATHTLQQAAGPVQGTPGPDGVAVSSPDDTFEQSAAATAEVATADFDAQSPVPVQGSFEAGPPELPSAAGGPPPIWRLAVQRCGPVPCDCPADERADKEAVMRATDGVPIQRVVADGSEIQGRIQGKVDADIQQAKQEQQQQASGEGEQASGEGEQVAEIAPREIDRAQVDAKKSELQGPAQPAIDPASQQGAVSSAADQAQASAEQPAQPLAEAAAQTPAPAGAGATSGGGVADAALDAATQAASVASQAFSQASALPMPDLPPAVAAPETVVPLDAAGQQLATDPEADSFTQSVATRVQALREQGHAVKARATTTRANAVRVQGNIQLAHGQVAQAQGGIQQSQQHTAARRDAVAQAQSALGVSQQKAATVAEQAPQVQSQADQGHAKTGPIASESQELSSGAASNTPDDSEAAANAQQSGQQLNQASGDTQSVDSTIAQTQTRAGSLAQEAAQATATNANTQSTIDATQATLDATDQRLTDMADQASQADAQLASLAAAPADIQTQADQQNATGDELIQASIDLETQLQAIQQDYLAGMASVPAAPAPSASSTAGGGPAVQREAADFGYDSRKKVNLANLWSSPDDLSPAERQQQEQQRQQQAQQQAQHRRDQLNEINQLSGGHFEQLDATDKMGIALQLTAGNLFNSVASINWPEMGANLIRGLIDPTVSLQGVLSGFNMVLSGGANLFSAEQWARDPLGNLLKSAADIVTGLTIILGSIAGLCLALTIVCGALIIFSFGTLAPVLGPAIAFFTSVMATVGPWAIEFAEVALVLQGLVLIKNLIDAATAQTADQLYTASEKMTEDAKTAGQMALQVGLAEVMGGGGEGPEAPTLEPEPAAIPAEPPTLEPLPEPVVEPEPVLEPGAEPSGPAAAEPTAVEPGAEPAAPEPAGEPAAPEGEAPASPEDVLEDTASKSGSELSPEEVQTEMTAAEAAESRPIDEPPFVEETELDNGHEWKETEEGELCRFSPGPGDCFTADGEMLAPEDQAQLGTRDESILSGDSAEATPMTPEEELNQLIADQAADMAEGDVGLTDVEPGAENILDRPEYQNSIANASEQFEKLNNIESNKNIASGMGGDQGTSGWAGEKAAATEQAQVEGMEAGHETEPHPFDQGNEGKYESSHSERQAAAGNSDQHFASSKDLCPQCQSWFSARAVAEGRPQFVADPQGVRVFTPDGGQTLVPHPSGAVTTPNPVPAGN
jgi:Domain of unknown function (DUF4157)